MKRRLKKCKIKNLLQSVSLKQGCWRNIGQKAIVFIFILLALLVNLGLLLNVEPIHPVYSQDIEEFQEEIEEKEEKKEEKKEILEETNKEIQRISESNMSISAKISALNNELKKSEESFRELEDNLEEKEKYLEIKEDTLKEKEGQVRESSSKLYKNSQFSILEAILSQDGNDNIFRFINYQRYSIRAHLREVRSVLAEYRVLQEEKEQLELEKKSLQVNREALTESIVSFENEKARLEQEMRTKIAMENSLKQDIMRLDKDLSKLTSRLQTAILAKANQTETPESSGGGNTGSESGVAPQQPSAGDGKYDLYIDGELVAEELPGSIRLVSKSNVSSGNNVFKVNGSLNYRGILEFRSDTNVYMINELPFEKYLYGLGEVPSSWPLESLKAQAVAGRGYAAKNWNKRSSKHYNLRDDTYDQNYVGYNKESASYGSKWVQVVNETQGKVLKSGSSIISAYYHSTCGGHTLASEEVWVSALPYTRAESDWYQSGGNWISYDKDSPWSYKRWGDTDINYDTLVDLLNATIYLAIDPSSSTRQNNIRRSDLGGKTPEEIVALLGEGNLITDKVGTITNVKSVYNNSSEGIDSTVRKTNKLRVYGSGGSEGDTVELSASVFRTVFNGRSPGSDHILYSNLWTAVKERENVWNFYTRGYPHRVGMCQYGAYGRAKAGQNYEQILTHYYRGTSLTSYNPSSAFRVGITRVATGDVYVKVVSGGDFYVYSHGTKVRTVGGDSTVRIVKR